MHKGQALTCMYSVSRRSVVEWVQWLVGLHAVHGAGAARVDYLLQL
jgi:hypothetical protein